jgi:hypothetical protein
VGRSGGMLVGVKKMDYDIVEVEKGDYFMRCLVVNKCDGFRWNLVIIYGDVQLFGKEAFSREFVTCVIDQKSLKCMGVILIW